MLVYRVNLLSAIILVVLRSTVSDSTERRSKTKKIGRDLELLASSVQI